MANDLEKLSLGQLFKEIIYQEFSYQAFKDSVAYREDCGLRGTDSGGHMGHEMRLKILYAELDRRERMYTKK